MGPRKNKKVEFEEILSDVIQESMDFNSTLKSNIAKNNANKPNDKRKKANSRFGKDNDLDSDTFPDLWD